MTDEQFARANQAAFAPPLAVAGVLSGLACRWLLAGGWAIDLFLGRATRPHHDVEIALARRDQHLLRAHLAGWSFEFVPDGAGSGYAPWLADMWLAAPVHELYARRSGDGLTDLEILLEEVDGHAWRFRRDPSLGRPWDELCRRSPLGIPYLRPEVTLLYKARQPRPTDEQDFEQVLPAIGEAAREWLQMALAHSYPGHGWLHRLAAS
jgi:hypothetical protein